MRLRHLVKKFSLLKLQSEGNVWLKFSYAGASCMKASSADPPLTELGSCPAIFSADAQGKPGLSYTMNNAGTTVNGSILFREFPLPFGEEPT